MNGWEDMLDELLEVESGLTGWELDFVESLDEQREAGAGWEPTDTQMEKLVEIHQERN